MWEDGCDDGSMVNDGGFFGGGPEEYLRALGECKLSGLLHAFDHM
jgi:hypothetical protein